MVYAYGQKAPSCDSLMDDFLSHQNDRYEWSDF